MVYNNEEMYKMNDGASGHCSVLKKYLCKLYVNCFSITVFEESITSFLDNTSLQLANIPLLNK